MQLFDQFETSQRSYDKSYQFLLGHTHYLPVNHTSELFGHIIRLRNNERAWKDQHSRVLSEVCRGELSPDALWEILKSYGKGENVPMISDANGMYSRKKIDLIVSMVKKGAIYIGYNERNLIPEAGAKDLYTLFVSDTAQQDEESWRENQKAIMEVLEHPKPQKVVAVVDLDVA